MSAAVGSTAGDTLAERAATLLERDILAGALAPGARLGIADLATHYGIGATPLREGMSRLVSRGLVVALGQRGFRAADVSRADLVDITSTRQLVEGEALRLAILQGDDAWEAGIVACLHRLTRFVGRVGASFGEGSDEFDRLHKEFHTSLIAACGSRRLLELHGLLYDQAYRYRRVIMARHVGAALFVRSHRALARVVMARDMAGGREMLHGHLGSTVAHVFRPSTPADPASSRGSLA